ncbi:hypothetical protein EYC84_002347 [Monilinia fructicola]|uniref:Uncharacterized protein n=1 Tax=Monilinia fructicola TaxID=38448 RepID=A0A5M9JPR9_MONFR|nr:hypothetical protein EYC84_002347 [Monilinia fructicola]
MREKEFWVGRYEWRDYWRGTDAGGTGAGGNAAGGSTGGGTVAGGTAAGGNAAGETTVGGTVARGTAAGGTVGGGIFQGGNWGFAFGSPDPNSIIGDPNLSGMGYQKYMCKYRFLFGCLNLVWLVDVACAHCLSEGPLVDENRSIFEDFPLKIEALTALPGFTLRSS